MRKFSLFSVVAILCLLTLFPTVVMAQDPDPDPDLTVLWHGDARDVVISPDRKKIVFSYSYWIYTVDLESGDYTLISSDSRSEHPTWSPDGSIAYSFYGDNGYVLAIVNSAGDKQIIADDLYWPTWSPTANRILAKDLAQNLYLLYQDQDGQNWNKTLLGQGSNPVWSPDGSSFLFETYRDGNSEIYRGDKYGANLVNLTNHAKADYAPSWSIDGLWIVFDSNRDANFSPYDRNYELYRMDFYTLDVTRLTFDVGLDAFSDISQEGRIIYLSEAAGLVVSGKPTLLVDTGVQLASINARRIYWLDNHKILVEGYDNKIVTLLVDPYDFYLPLIARLDY